MSRLSELIAELCPNGVRFVRFAEVADYVRGVSYSKYNEVRDANVESVPVLRANNITLEHNTLNFTDVKRVSLSVQIKASQYLRKDDILICAGSGSKEHVGKVAFISEDMSYSFGAFMGVVRVKDVNVIAPRFMFHSLACQRFRDYLRSALEAVTIYHLSTKAMNDFTVPIPPLQVQHEIARLLDNLTSNTSELITQLEAEIIARRKQCNYYRDKLLTFTPIQEDD